MYTYSKELLPNGLRVIYLEIPHIHSVVMSAYIGVGSRYEEEKNLGISHFLEHMLFRGTKLFKNSFELFQAIDNIGGDIDAYTSPEYSAVIIQVHNKHIERGINILGDIIFGQNFRSDDIEIERRIIQEEMRQFVDVKGDYVCIDDMSFSLMWKEGSAEAPLFGDEKTIAALRAKDLNIHYKKFFAPENIVLCISGKFEKDMVAHYVNELFGNAQGKFFGQKPPLKTTQTEPRCLFKKSPSQTVSFKLCHKAYPYKHEKAIIMLLIADVLGGGISSRLSLNVRERLGLVYDITSYPTMFSDVGSIDIYTSTKRENFEKTTKAVMDEVRKLYREGITEQELNQTEERVFSQTQLIMDSPLAMANWFGIEELLITPETPDTPEKQAQKIHNIKLEDVHRTIAEIFIPEKRNFIVVGTYSWLNKKHTIAMLK
ncbi:MAG: insulinase family protein [Candidatus Brocadia sp. AMX2]|uniref:Peptidase M16 family n=1 Tax=Candidatus Brocadia sinica JPN1 TaxID=1197129 RepID=A0ABQ0JZS0_9BACT|nr:MULTISPECIES: pitrilysin family protein [Brocadia]MBC6931198.1 insulinase family protein [Candidatus Brocadia sp.]MBL1168631.1 insulinase family protein [Candidatus Brocadia sp. AMX1]MCK6467286.1 insulinase family protein [Candidatus Brocadia sinica]NOG40169.1 insulinase family protein [Planctomycetota bacterium]KAA0246097.1 MAG: insulinase family protein [Candidatus Brocadia sp. AMX2]